MRWKPQSSSCLRSKGNNLWIADTIIFFEGTWDVGMGCSARGEGRQAGQTLEGSKGSLLVVSPPTATRNDGFFGVCTIFCSSQSVHALLNSNRRFLSRNIRQEIIIFFSEMFASSSEMLIRVVLRHPTHLRPTQPPLHRHLSSRKCWNSPPRLVLTSAPCIRS